MSSLMAFVPTVIYIRINGPHIESINSHWNPYSYWNKVDRVRKQKGMKSISE
jgi:hypothetical protein